MTFSMHHIIPITIIPPSPTYIYTLGFYIIIIVDMFHLTQNDYGVLSTYVTDIGENNKDPTNVPHLCMVEFTSSIRNWGTKECSFLTRPKLTNAMWGAGLSFHRCHAELNVPVDPYLDNVFDGEEGSRGIRFFTHGYDVYTPHRVLVTHDYVSMVLCTAFDLVWFLVDYSLDFDFGLFFVLMDEQNRFYDKLT